ncbi:MAG: SH3 domain-containing protein [Rubellimicrobium sp.]|nr:SH3 domain-containing protein [Rubellimicrobium sp.]
MNRFVFVSLLVMAWAYWELSGGAGFVPETRPAAEGVTVTRADTSVIDTLAPPAPADPFAADPVSEPLAEALPGLAPEALPAGDDGIDAVLGDVVGAAPEIAPEPAFEGNPLITPEGPAATPVADLRVVTGNRVNLREGPGTGHAQIGQLTSGTILEVVETTADGWARIMVQGSGETGWMSASFLMPLNG